MIYGISVKLGRKRKTLKRKYRTKREAQGYKRFLLKHKKDYPYKNPRVIKIKKR